MSANKITISINNTNKVISVKETIAYILKDLWTGTFGRETSSENVINIQKAILSDIGKHQELIKKLNDLNSDENINKAIQIEINSNDELVINEGK